LFGLATGGLCRWRGAHRLAGGRQRRALLGCTCGGLWCCCRNRSGRLHGRRGSEFGASGFRSGFHVFQGDHAIGAAGANPTQIDAQLFCQRAHGGNRLDASDTGGQFHMHAVAALHGTDHGTGIRTLGGWRARGRCRCRFGRFGLGRFRRPVVMAGGFGFGALRQLGVYFNLNKCRAGLDHVAGLAMLLDHLARERRRHFNHRFGRFHGNQWFVQACNVARLDEPFDDGGIRQSFTEVGKVENFRFAHAMAPCAQLAESVFLAAATILSTLGRYFISRRNSGMCTS
jgi:hypothetical protein